MLNAILEGFLFGFGMIAFVGPVFFTLLQSSLQFGLKAGISVAIGIFVSDVLCVVLCYLGADIFFRNAENEFWIGIIGSLILLVIGLNYIIKPKTNTHISIHKKSFSYPAFFLKGFLVNFVNPFVFGVWITIISYGKSTFNTRGELFIFLGVALTTILLTDSTKALVARQIKKFLSPRVLLITFRVIGVLLILFSIRILLYVFDFFRMFG